LQLHNARGFGLRLPVDLAGLVGILDHAPVGERADLGVGFLRVADESEDGRDGPVVAHGAREEAHAQVLEVLDRGLGLGRGLVVALPHRAHGQVRSAGIARRADIHVVGGIDPVHGAVAARQALLARPVLDPEPVGPVRGGEVRVRLPGVLVRYPTPGYRGRGAWVLDGAEVEEFAVPVELARVC